MTRRVGVISDSHGDRASVRTALARLAAQGALDALIHCGDGLGDMRDIARDIPQVVRARGNCDGLWLAAEEECVIDINGARIFVAHGHRYHVKAGLALLTARARALGARAACFGHTHAPCAQWQEGVLLLNPGACASAGRCALLTVDRRGEVACTLY